MFQLSFTYQRKAHVVELYHSIRTCMKIYITKKYNFASALSKFSTTSYDVCAINPFTVRLLHWERNAFIQITAAVYTSICVHFMNIILDISLIHYNCLVDFDILQVTCYGWRAKGSTNPLQNTYIYVCSYAYSRRPQTKVLSYIYM